MMIQNKEEKMKPIFLIGFMGSGKTTIGTELAQILSCTYKDTDHIVEINQGCAIASIFAHEGEQAFRDYESYALKQTIDAQIISTGGGIIERSENRHFMKNNGIVIYLQTHFEDINMRLQQDPTRPLWNHNDINEKRKLFDKRLPIYEACADYIVDTHQRSVEEIVKDIKENILMHNHKT